MARKAIPSSLRWHIFARDGFTCRYCGARAGADGVELAVDHVVSVADGGDNHPDNLLTACRQCNGGKSARSATGVPTPEEVVARIKAMASTTKKQVKAMQAATEAKKQLKQEIVNMKCTAYGTERCTIANNEVAIAAKLMTEFGADKLAEWYAAAAQHRVTEWQAIRYICGCAKNERARNAQ